MPGKRLTAKDSQARRASVGGPIVIVGVGHMGGAFARGLIAAGFGADLILIDPAMKPAAARELRKSGAQTAGSADVLAGLAPCAIILAVKPQMMAAVAPAYAQAAKKSLVISIAAGTSIESLRLWLKSPNAIVRAMPNLPASIGKGISAAHATRGTTTVQKRLADKLLRALGDLVWLDGEEMLNAVTAVSGSGPAYVFLLVEAIAAAAERVGLSPAVAKQLARKTVEGTGALLSTTEEDAADLRRSVTSPGGTTEAALKVLMASDRFQELLADAIEAATARGFELAKTR